MANQTRAALRQIRWDVHKHLTVLVAVPLVLGGLAGLAAKNRASVRASTARILVSSPTTEQPFDHPIVDVMDARSLATEVAIFSTSGIREAASQRLGFPATATATVDPAADVLLLTATAPSFNESRQIVDAYARAYVDRRRDVAQRALRISRERVQQEIDRLDAELSNVPAVSSGSSGVAAQRESLGQQRAVLRARVTLLDLGAARQTGAAVIVNEADVPTRPRTLPLAVLAGVIAGVALVLGALAVGRRLAKTLLSSRAATEVAGSVPVLVAVAHHRRLRSRPFEVPGRGSPTGENIRFLASLIERWSDGASVVQVTSAIQGEGVSTIAAQLAAALHERGLKTALVGPFVGRWTDRRRLTVPDGLTLAELPTTAGAGALRQIRNLRSHYEYVVIDSPAVLASGTALRWAQAVDLSLVVVEPERVTRTQLSQALAAIAAGREPARGIIVNNVLFDRHGVPLL